jgi:hypothetical protein
MADHGAGQLREKVAFDERANQSDGYGNEEGDFVEQFQRRAGFTFLRGGETVIAGRLEGRQPIVVRVRADSSTRRIQPDWRMRDLRNGSWQGASGEPLYWAGPVYAVRSVAPVDDGRMFLDVTVEGGVAA